MNRTPFGTPRSMRHAKQFSFCIAVTVDTPLHAAYPMCRWLACGSCACSTNLGKENSSCQMKISHRVIFEVLTLWCTRGERKGFRSRFSSGTSDIMYKILKISSRGKTCMVQRVNFGHHFGCAPINETLQYVGKLYLRLEM